MLRFVQVPTVYCRDPLDDMFDSPWYFQHAPRSVPCRRRRVCSPPMTYPTFGSFIAAMEAMDTSSCDENKETENTCSTRCCQKQKTKGSAEDKDQSSVEQTPNDTCSSSTSVDDQSSEIEPKTEVSIPVSKASDIDSRRFHISLNLSSFNPDNIEVKRVDNELKIHAKQEVERSGMVFHREIQRSYHLPDDIDSESLKSTLSAAGVLTVEAQRTPKDSNTNSQQSEENQKEESTSDIQGSEGLETEESEQKPADEEVKEEIQDHADHTPTDEMEVEETEKLRQEDLKQ